VTAESFHETGIAVGAVMLAACIGINHIGIKLGFGEDGFGMNFFEEHSIV